MIIRSDKITPVRPIGSSVTITCTVGLPSMVVDTTVPLVVNIYLANSEGIQLHTTAQSISGSTYSYNSEAVIRSFGRPQSGIYTCEATVSSPSRHLTESSTATDETSISSGIYIITCVLK